LYTNSNLTSRFDGSNGSFHEPTGGIQMTVSTLGVVTVTQFC
jgi:hypothetical protein